NGDVRDGITHAVSKPRRAPREVRSRRDPDTRLAADQPLGAELIVGERQHRAHTELPVQLVERGGAETPPEISPHTEPARNLIPRRGTGADDGVVAIRETWFVVGGWRAAGGVHFEVVRVVVPP